MSGDSPLATLLTLAAAKNGASDSFRDQNHHNEEQETQTMMYAARMTYLDSSEAIDPLFLTRKQAQKMAQQHQDVKLPLKRIEPRKAATANLNGPNIVVWKKGKASAASGEKQQTWKPRFQAGCHFYECLETGECRVSPQGSSPATASSAATEDDSGEDDAPFPDSFAFLYASRK